MSTLVQSITKLHCMLAVWVRTFCVMCVGEVSQGEKVILAGSAYFGVLCRTVGV